MQVAEDQQAADQRISGRVAVDCYLFGRVRQKSCPSRWLLV
jgi:hypothetical protein